MNKRKEVIVEVKTPEGSLLYSTKLGKDWGFQVSQFVASFQHVIRKSIFREETEPGDNIEGVPI